MASPTYQANQQEITETGIKYFFVSKGHRAVIKAVEYYYVNDLNGRKVYNLGFGDYDIANDKIDDKTNTENGDKYLVFNTVISTIPIFFQTFGDVIIWVKGSDSSDEFEEKCRETCKRNNCKETCKKKHQRIKLYCDYVNRNYETLIEEFEFFGGIVTENGTEIERFIKNKNYKSVLLIKK